MRARREKERAAVRENEEEAVVEERGERVEVVVLLT